MYSKSMQMKFLAANLSVQYEFEAEGNLPLGPSFYSQRKFEDLMEQRIHYNIQRREFIEELEAEIAAYNKPKHHCWCCNKYFYFDKTQRKYRKHLQSKKHTIIQNPIMSLFSTKTNDNCANYIIQFLQ